MSTRDSRLIDLRFSRVRRSLSNLICQIIVKRKSRLLTRLSNSFIICSLFVQNASLNFEYAIIVRIHNVCNSILWSFYERMTNRYFSPIVFYFQNEIEKGIGCIRFIDLENDQRRAWNCSYEWLCSTSTTSTLLVSYTGLITSNIIIVNECSKFPSSFTRLRIPHVRRIRFDTLWTYLRKWNREITIASEFRSSILLCLVPECSMIKVRRMETRSEEWKIDRGNGTSV